MITYTTKALMLTLFTLWLGIFGMSLGYALTFSEAQKLLASDGAEIDNFGRSVSLSGDTAMIGAPFDDDNGRSSGSAYVFVRDDAGAWHEQQKLTASDDDENDRFGSSVSISGDTAMIGALFADDDNGIESGSAYVFVRDGAGVWREQQKLIASDGTDGDRFGNSVSISGDTVMIGALFDDDNGYSSGSVYVFEANAGEFQAVKSLGDINADGSEDIAVLVHDAAAGTVTATVKDAEDDHLIKAISFNLNRIPVAFEVMADIDGNGAPELVVLGEGSVVVEIRDSMSGNLQNTVSFNPTRAPIDLAILADQNGNSIPELAVLGRSSVDGAVSVVVKDALTKQTLNYVGFNFNFTPIELAVLADLNGNAKVEFAVLGVDATTAGHDKVEIRDSATDAVLNNVFYSPTIQAKRLVVLPDQNNNVAEELAVLREGRYVIVQINDALNDTLVNHIGYNPSFTLGQVLVIPDLNGNGVPEIGVLGTDPASGQTRVQINDAQTAVKISNVYFGKVFKPQGDVALVDDINGNGSAELAYLGKRKSDGKLRVIIKDSLTKAVINTVDFPPFPPSYAIGDTGPAGGIVFYVTDGGRHGLEAAPGYGAALIVWADFCTPTPIGTKTAIGTGAQNTAAIVAGCVSSEVTAAEVADAYELNGFTDWFLPSKDELWELYVHRAFVADFPDIGCCSIYWSSSESDSRGYALAFNFNNPNQNNGPKGGASWGHPFGVLPVRSF